MSEGGMVKVKHNVRLIWDEEERIWYTHTDIPGLCLEAETFDGLVEEVRLAAPEMLDLNCDYTGPIHLVFEAVRIEIAEAS